jgi:hypothetical protein
MNYYLSLNEKIILNWDDIEWGYRNNYLGWKDILKYASAHNTINDSDYELVKELTQINKESAFLISTILDKLVKDKIDDEDISGNVMFMLLYNLYIDRNKVIDPLAEVEKIYEDFNYPEEIESFVRYMPPKDGYDPSLYSYEENLIRLFENWKSYLISKGASETSLS